VLHSHAKVVLTGREGGIVPPNPMLGLKSCMIGGWTLPEDSWILCGRICHLDTHGPVALANVMAEISHDQKETPNGPWLSCRSFM